MEITEITKLLESDNYVDRFKGEYWLALTKVQKLDKMIEKYDKGELDFTPSCPIKLLVIQSSAMHEYISILAERANEYEGITLE